MSRPRRVALIGLGMASAPHLAALRDLSDRVEIGAAYAPSAARRAAVAAAHPALSVSGDLDAILADPTITLAFVLTPPGTHGDLVRRLAAAGKHVLLEKPVETDLARAEATVAAADAAGVRLGMMLQHRFRPTSLRLAALIRDGALGDVVSASAAIRWWRPPGYFTGGRGTVARDGGGVLLTQAIHTLDLYGSLAGPIASVAAAVATSPLRVIDTEDVVGAAITFRNGAVGTIDATTVSYPGFPERIEIAGTAGTAILAADALDVFWQDGRRDSFEGGGGGGGGADPMAFSHGPHRAAIADMLDALDAGREPTVSGRAALAVHRLIDAILRSAAAGRRVEIPA